MTEIQNDRFLRLPEVLKVVPFGKSTLWRLISENKFPKPHKISPRVTAWLASDIQEYIYNVKSGITCGYY